MSYCFRCGSYSLEQLRTHTYCIECNYSPVLDDWHPPETDYVWFHKQIPNLRPNILDLSCDELAA